MKFHFIVLWTDALIYTLALGVLIFVIWAQRQEQLFSAWRQLRRNHLAMVSMIALSSYMIVGLLDSIHFRYENSHQEIIVESFFDYVVSPLNQEEEKTYSAPFATHLYTKEMIMANGKITRDYPRLQYGGADLQNPLHDRLSDILKRCLIASLSAVCVWIFLSLIVMQCIVIHNKQTWSNVLNTVMRGATEIPWRTILIAVGILLLLIFNAFYLSKAYHILGTDKVGHDIFYETLKSIRTGLIIGTLTTLVIMPFAVIFGMLAGYFRGWIDDLIQYVYTTLSSVPDVLLIAAAILALQVLIANHPDYFPNLIQRADIRLFALCVILGVTSWTNLCRLLRGETLKLREQDYVQAAIVLGVKRRHILIQHILPNLMHLIVIAVVMDFSGLVLAEAVLTYVGVGVDPTTISWGNMINAARMELAREPIVWWPLLGAFIFMFPLVITANLFADSVRDALDPRIRQQQ